jgi:hypothetical protein
MTTAGTMNLDAEATTARREKLLAERKSRAKPYSEFIEAWQKQSPPEKVLQYYGHYPFPDQAAQGA